jgi:hypothetical protein
MAMRGNDVDIVALRWTLWLLLREQRGSGEEHCTA